MQLFSQNQVLFPLRSISTLTLLIFLFGCKQEKNIRQDLVDLVKKGSPEKYYHWNTARAEMYKQEMESSNDLSEKLKSQYLYWTELVNAGKTEQAIDLMSQHLEGESGITLTNLDRGTKPIFDLLAVAYLRLGEQQNCLENHSNQSCIIPFHPKVIHTLKNGSERAIKLYEIILKKYPTDYQSKWLLNLAHLTLGNDSSFLTKDHFVKYPNWSEQQQNFPPFRNISMYAGVNISGLSGGSCVDDFNNDGLLDIFATSYGMADQVRLLFNKGKQGFQDVTEKSGLIGITGGLNAVHADYNNDGNVDIFVLRGGWLTETGQHPNSLLKNNGDGSFEDVTYASGLGSKYPTQTAAWADYDQDGWLDLFIGNESFEKDEVFGELFHNNQDGTFTEVAKSVGISISSITKGVAWGDINNDGWPDLYVSNLGSPNKLYRNDEGVFKDISRSARIQSPNFSFPCWFWDYNNDGLQDILVASYDMNAYTNVGGVFYNEIKNGQPNGELLRLYQNNGDETFTNVAREMNLNKTMHAMGSNFGDLDNDGFMDFYVGTGAPNPMSAVPNRMFRNVAGEGFEEVTAAGGFGHLQKGHAVSFADFDNDGDQDIYAVIGGAFEGDVFENALFENPGFENNWISLDLKGVKSNKSAIGTRIKITTMEDESVFHLYATVSTGGSFGASSLRQELGIGKSEVIVQLEITWPSGLVQEFKEVKSNNFYQLTEGDRKLLEIVEE